MTKEQYIQKLKDLEAEFENKKGELVRLCAFSNNTIKVGDVITDHSGSIKVEKIQVAFGYACDLPSCVYTGIELNKDGTPNKKGKKRSVWQSNLVK
jgi:hypothetical protein